VQVLTLPVCVSGRHPAVLLGGMNRFLKERPRRTSAMPTAIRLQSALAPRRWSGIIGMVVCLGLLLD